MSFLKQMQMTFLLWRRNEIPRMGASIAFYSLLSIAPILMIAITIAEFFSNKAAAQQQLLSWAQQYVGNEAHAVVQTVFRNTTQKGVGTNAAVAITTLFVSASLAVSELQAAIYKIWDLQVMSFLLRLRSMGIILISSFLISALALVGWAVQIAEKFLNKFGLNFNDWLSLFPSRFVSTVATFLLFCLVLKLIPATVKIPWKNAFKSAGVSTILFWIATTAVGMYMAKTGSNSVYGAASSLVFLMVWVYFVTQVLLFGSALCCVLTSRPSTNRRNRNTS